MITKPKTYDYLVFWASCAVYVFAFVFLCATYFPNSVIHFKYAVPRLVATVYPVRYDFYVGAANGQMYQLYHIENNKAILYDIRPFTPRFLFGLKRDGKIIASELEGIALDTTFMPTATKYPLRVPANTDINNYLRADTLKYNDYHSPNVQYLKGKILMTIAPGNTWQQQRTGHNTIDSITVVPLNLISAQ